jgi:hypothetical protein
LLPWFVRDHVNRTLDRNQLYAGNIGQVRIHLWRGAYSVNDRDPRTEWAGKRHSRKALADKPRLPLALSESLLQKAASRQNPKAESPRAETNPRCEIRRAPSSSVFRNSGFFRKLGLRASGFGPDTRLL